MRVTIIGSGDAFCSGGRAHCCIEVAAGGRAVLVDFGASAILAFKAQGRCFQAIDAVVVSHLHGDHFGGLPFLLLDCQFVGKRQRPLPILGPPGLKARLHGTMELLYPDLHGRAWSFDWPVIEIEPDVPVQIEGFDLRTIRVHHPSGAPATGLRLSRGGKTFAFSGDTGWTPRLFDIAAHADLYVTECGSGYEKLPMHIDWPTLRDNLAAFSARKIVVTHLGPSALPRIAEMQAAGVVVAQDGQVFDI